MVTPMVTLVLSPLGKIGSTCCNMPVHASLFERSRATLLGWWRRLGWSRRSGWIGFEERFRTVTVRSSISSVCTLYFDRPICITSSMLSAEDAFCFGKEGLREKLISMASSRKASTIARSFVCLLAQLLPCGQKSLCSLSRRLRVF